MSFFQDQMLELNPLSYRFIFKGVATPTYLDLEHLNGEYRPLQYDGHFIHRDGHYLYKGDDFKPEDLVYLRWNGSIKNNVCKCPRWFKRKGCKSCELKTALCIRIESKNPGRLLTQGDGPVENVVLTRCHTNPRRALSYYVKHGVKGISYGISWDPWVIDRDEDTFVQSAMVNPAENERTMTQALAANCIRSTLFRSGDIGPSFQPTWTEDRASRYVKDPKVFCTKMKQRETIRPHKVIHSVGVTDNDAIWSMIHDDAYLGIFKKGDHQAFFRLSLGVRPQAGGNAGTNASFGIKIPRSGIHACDIMAMFDFEGQNTGNMFQHILGTTISNPIIPHGSQEVGDKFQKLLDKIGNKRAGLISLQQCAMYDVDGMNERKEGGMESHPRPFPFSLIFVPNPLMWRLCEEEYATSQNTFECFSTLAQTGKLEKMRDAHLSYWETQSVADTDSETAGLGQPNQDDDATVADLAFKAQTRTAAMKDMALKHFYKIVAIDSPMDLQDMTNNRTAFKCLGYIKRKPTATGFATHPWSDDHIRFTHDNFENHMFKDPNGGKKWKNKKNLRTWWGRTTQEMLAWKRKIRWGKKFKEQEGPKEKYEPFYREAFWRMPAGVAADDKADMELYQKMKDFVTCDDPKIMDL